MPAIDNYASFQNGLDSPASSAVAVTPADGADLALTTRGLYIGVAGDVKVDMADGTTVTYKAAPVGFMPTRVRRVYATGTAATNILALY